MGYRGPIHHRPSRARRMVRQSGFFVLIKRVARSDRQGASIRCDTMPS
jgi:hypothetical protein